MYELALGSVAERGPLNGVKMIEKKTTKIRCDKSMGSINEIPKPTLDSTPNPLPDPIIPQGKLIYHKKETKRSYQDDLRRDLSNMLSCAEKSTVQLLAYFEEMLAGDLSHLQEDNVINPLLEQLNDQIKKEELLSEQIQESFRDLGRHIDNHDAPSIVRFLRKLPENIRPMYLQEIMGFVKTAKDAAKLIHGKDIILLVGETGSGKSTTIQFLAGCKMTKIKVESEPGKSLEHIVVTEPINNPGLKNVISSPRNKSEARSIIPVTIQLKDIIGSHKREEIILCDEPGFGDTASSEIDIANSVGVIEAIKGCKSVKILALSIYRRFDDRGQGIHKLSHLLIKMISTGQDRLHTILYGFTKYPPTTDISALLADIKRSQADENPRLQLDSAFVSVLKAMIEKINSGDAENIDPVRGCPKNT